MPETETVIMTETETTVVVIRIGMVMVEERRIQTEMVQVLDRAITAVRVIVRIMAVTRIITVLSEIMTVIREAMEGRTISSESRHQARALCRRLQSRIPKSIEMKKNAESVRKKINVPKKI